MRLMKKIVCLMLIICMVATLVPSTAFAADIVASGTCGGEDDGPNLVWTLTSDGLLTISGRGSMSNYTDAKNTPWYNYRNSIIQVKAENGVASIGDYAFSYFYSIQSVSLSNSVTSIGTRAFFYCTAIKNVNLGKGVASIGAAAFSDCESLKNITIPDSVTVICDDAFSSSGLISITIPDSVTSLGGWAFEDCKSLTRASIGDGITKINIFTFYYCESLTDVKIGRSVVSIGSSAFRYCSMKSVVIPESVKSLGDYSFYNNFNIEKVYFMGDAPSFARDDPFERCATMYYRAGKTGWSNVSYNKAQWDPYALTYTSKMSNSKYAIIVENSKGEAISGATVSYDTQICTTNINGVAQFDKRTLGQPTVKVTCPEYRDYSNANTNYDKSPDSYEVIVLYTTEESENMLSYARYNCRATLVETDVLTGTMRMSLSNTGFSFNLICGTVDCNSSKTYELIQDTKIIAESKSGSFAELQVGSFEPGKKVFVRVINEDGVSVDTPINLEFVDDKAQKETGFKLGKKTEFTVDSDIPFVGGSKLSFDLPEIPVECYVDEDTVYVGVNVKIISNQPDKSTKDNIKEIAKTIYQIKKLSAGDYPGKSLQAKLNSMMKSKNLQGEWGPATATLSVVGYGKSKLDCNGEAEVTAYICLLGSVSTTFQGPTVMLTVIPVTYSVKISAEGKLSAQASYNIKKSTLSGDVKLTVTPGVEAFGGVGIGKLCGVGVYGSAKLPIEFQIVGTTTTPGLNYVDLIGDHGLKAYVGMFEYKKSWAYSTWHLYTRTNQQTASLASEETPEQWYTGALDGSNYSQAQLDYLAGESGWLGGGVSLQSEDTSTNEFTALQTQTYRNMNPVIGSADGTPVMVWVRANTQRGEYNYPQLVYSVYNNGAWSEPRPVDPSNETIDSEPCLCTDSDGTLWLAYENTEICMDENTTLADYSAAQSIVAARFDNQAGEFSDFVTVSENGVFSKNPSITADGGATTVAWIANTDSSDYFGQNSTNALCVAKYSGGAWRAPAQVASGLNAVSEIAIGSLNGTVSVATITDADNDLSTNEDRTLTVYPSLGNGETIVSCAAVSAVKIAKLPGDASLSLLWSDGTNLQKYDGAQINALLTDNALSSGYTVLGDRIVYSSSDGDNSSNLFALVHDENGWNSAVKITTQDKYLQSYSVADVGGVTYIAGVQASVAIGESDAVDENCTLSWCTLSARTDLGVTSVSADVDAEAPNAKVPITVEVANNGDTPISQIAVSIKNGTTEMASNSFDVNMAPGTNTELQIELPLDATIEKTEYTVTATTDGDCNADNDSSTVTVGYSDLSVSTQLIQIGGKRSILAQVTNAGAVATGGGLTVSYGENTISSMNISKLEPGESTIAYININDDAFNGDRNGILTVKALADEEEKNEFNNTSMQFVSWGNNNTISIISVTSEEAKLNVVNDDAATIIVAVYDLTGKMVKAATLSISTNAGDVTVPLGLSELPQDCIVKAFALIGGVYTPMCQLQQWTQANG